MVCPIVESMTRQAISDPPWMTQPFLGSDVTGAGLLSAAKLRSQLFTRLFHNVYVPAHLPLTHELRCQAAALIAPATATITGASAAAVHGHDLAAPFDPVELVVPERDRFTVRRGMHIRRSTLGSVTSASWRGIRLATPLRATLDILRDNQLRRSLPHTVGWLDVLLRGGFIDVTTFSMFLQGRRDHGVVRARKALALADPRSDSVPESEIRVWLRLGGLVPEIRAEVLGFRLGLCFPADKLAVEYGDDSAPAHHQRWRHQRLRAEGWQFVVVTPEQLLTDPKGMVERVREALRHRPELLSA